MHDDLRECKQLLTLRTSQSFVFHSFIFGQGHACCKPVEPKDVPCYIFSICKVQSKMLSNLCQWYTPLALCRSTDGYLNEAIDDMLSGKHREVEFDCFQQAI